MRIAFLQCDHVRLDLQSYLGGGRNTVFKKMLKDYDSTFENFC